MSVERVQQAFRDVFGDPSLLIAPTTTAADVPGWDSFNHINLIIALEEAFNIRFSSDEVASMANVGDLVRLLQAKGLQVSWGGDE